MRALELVGGGNVFKMVQNSQKEGVLCVFASLRESEEPKAASFAKAQRSDPLS